MTTGMEERDAESAAVLRQVMDQIRTVLNSALTGRPGDEMAQQQATRIVQSLTDQFLAATGETAIEEDVAIVAKVERHTVTVTMEPKTARGLDLIQRAQASLFAQRFNQGGTDERGRHQRGAGEDGT